MNACIGRKVVAAAFFAAQVALAHVPFLETDDYTALRPCAVADAALSTAYYSWLGPASDVDFYTFEIATSVVFHAESLVPVCRPYAEFRPAFALIGPGLPPPTVSLPVPLLPGYGAIVLLDNGASPRPSFYEPFGDKSYYQGPVLDLTLTQPGLYTCIFWNPAGTPGDYVAVFGYVEDFTGSNLTQALKNTPIIRRDGELHTVSMSEPFRLRKLRPLRTDRAS